MSQPNQGGRYFSPKQPKTRINHEIRAASVRLIDSNGTQIGIRALTEALTMARAKGLDLVEVAPEAKPPVCKILAYSKFKYEQDKKDRESRKHQKTILLKEVRLSPVIGSHDFEIKMKHAEEFLKERDKVRFTVVFRGRQNRYDDMGYKLLASVKERLAAIATVESSPSKDNNRMSMTLAPKK